MDKRFLLTTPLAEQLYEHVARDLPLVDYHNHLSIADVAANRQFENIAELWLLGDPYKHRVMRICGVEERLITGSASAKEKFTAWCRIFPNLLGNPLYDWSRMEMEWVFGIDLPICEANADVLWEAANAKLALPEFSARGLLKRFGCEYIAPCTAILDDLAPFADNALMAPSLRGDDLLAPSLALLRRLSELTGVAITDRGSLYVAIKKRLDAFHAVGCRYADHALDNGFVYLPDDGRSEERLAQLLSTGVITDKAAFASDMLRLLADTYAGHGWVMQLHIGAQRFTSSRLRALAGAAGGFACIGHTADVASIARMLDDLESAHSLPRTLLFTLNPADTEVMSVLTGSYSEDGIASKVGQGPAWLWCDHAQGMRQVLDSMSSYSVLSTFIGMTTDSRSILSMLRHDYFRRVLCSWLGKKVESGDFPNDFDLLASIVRKLSYENAANSLKAAH